MRIDDLLTRYFEGETTSEEERELKRFFTQGEVPENLEIYRPLFIFFHEEAKKNSDQESIATSHTIKPKQRLFYSLGGIAAGLLIILSIAGINKYLDRSQNFVIIDGQKYADVGMAREQAQAAFGEVSFTREDIFETLFSE